MSRHDDALYLRHIREALSKAMAWTVSSRQAFFEEEFRQSAVIRQLEIAGEAAGCLSEVFRQAHPMIAARELKALRNVLIHAYSDVDVETVWDVVQNDLPRLQHALEQMEQEPEIGD